MIYKKQDQHTPLASRLQNRQRPHVLTHSHTLSEFITSSLNGTQKVFVENILVF